MRWHLTALGSSRASPPSQWHCTRWKQPRRDGGSALPSGMSDYDAVAWVPGKFLFQCYVRAAAATAAAAQRATSVVASDCGRER